MLVNSYQEKDQGTPLLKCLTDFEIDAKLTVLNVNAGFFAFFIGDWKRLSYQNRGKM